ncbi:caspase family protein [Spirulina subsalsa FACHB-351]|uniref:Caspase family protein n=1 Tax=Spirulina subsalsa FACHB-351 TaxID=234711 RepID=A0ABT3L1P9_9CYAN|nr:caspase family protein [Spirulina subsalsa]MCW6035428.1 caspase family protein [Spirulina subsalsa FACHB-351]
MGLDRRTFLQGLGLGLLTWGGQWMVSPKAKAFPLGNAYAQGLATPTGRKLALLVGIDQYPYKSPLQGCGTDVALQRELLVHRFGFQRGDIVSLLNQEATRENIESAFSEHLIQQAKEGDRVVFHFSGYGSQVRLPGTTEEGELLVRSLVPADGVIATKGEPAVNDLLEETLILLARSLSTRHVTLVLDTSYASNGPELRGNLRSRSSPSEPAKRPSPEELAFQEQLRLLRSAGRSATPLNWGKSSFPGFILTAAAHDQPALESQWNGFSAGLFTYALTQYLWESTPPSTLYISLTRATETLRPLTTQQPQGIGTFSGNPPLVYDLPLQPTFGAEGAIIAIDEEQNMVQLTLGGLPAGVLDVCGNSRFWVVEGEITPETPQVQIRSRNGLKAKAKGVDSPATALKVGQWVQEAIRVLPRHIGLVVALDNALQRIERVDATSAFANIKVVSSVVTAGEQRADCLFGKAKSPHPVTVAMTDLQPLDRPPTKGYELFSVGNLPIPNTLGMADEAVRSAVNRLIPHLKTLLAGKLWGLMVNEGSSRLGVTVRFQLLQPQPMTLLERSTGRYLGGVMSQNAPNLADRTSTLVTLPVGGKLECQLVNQGDRKLYVLLVGLDPLGNPLVLYTPALSSLSDPNYNAIESNSLQIEAGQTLTLPRTPSNLNWFITGSTGVVELFTLFSTEPFSETLTLLTSLANKGEGDRFVELPNPQEVAQAILQDIHNASAVSPDILSSPTDFYALNVETWAGLHFVLQVV